SKYLDLAECTKYDCAVELEISADCAPHPLPCNNTTATEYGCSSPLLTDKALSKGDKVIAKALYQNSKGNYWYQLEDGTFLWSQYTENPEVIEPWIENGGFPEQIYDATYLQGTIVTGGSRLDSVQALVFRGNLPVGSALLQSSAIAVDGYSYELEKSQVDYSLPFQNLASFGPGTYTLTYRTTFTTCYIEAGELQKESKSAYTSEYYTFIYGTPGACDHSYSSAIIQNPGCTSDGAKTYTCAKCGDVYSETIPATGHAYGSWYTEISQSCTTDGLMVKTCGNCGDVQQQVIPAAGHSYETQLIGATCTDYEKIRYICTKCNNSYDEYVELEWSDWSPFMPQGIDEAFIESRLEYRRQTKEFTTGTAESMDGWILYDTTTQMGDYGAWSQWSDTVVSANANTRVETRELYGYYYFLCPYCGAHMHGYGNCYTWAGGCGRTTDVSGWRQIYSTTSWNAAELKDWYGTGKYYTYIDGQLVFKWTDGGTKTQYRYSTREPETVYQFYRWSDWSEWNVTEYETTDVQNVETQITYRYVVTPKAAHSYTAKVTAPTCTTDGYTTYTCSVCGDSYVADEVEALGHEAYTYTYDSTNKLHNFTCTKCGEVTSVATTAKFGFNTAAPALSVDIVMNIATTLPTGFSDPYMVIEFNGKTTTLTDYTINATNGR
ncbi:MAG: hypothetical protein J6C66_07355, partial [Prevotella sp.]|nr:hypothetical protein [Prevotella sp.]